MRYMRHILISLSFLLLVIPGVIFSQGELKVDYLENMRQNIVFPELNNDEKRIIAEQAQILLQDLYVHRFHKLDYYPRLDDPVAQIQEIVNTSDNLTTAELEEAIYRIFVAQRDLHLNYIFPNPVAKYTSFLPFTLVRVSQGNNFFQVRVHSVNEELFRQYYPDQKIPQVGDRVLYYDNLPILNAVKRQMETSQGANLFGGFTRALGQMTFIRHLLHLVPAEDEIKITFQCYKTRNRYSLQLPWLVQWIESPSILRKPGPGLEDRKERKIGPRDLLQSEDIWQKEYNEFLAQTNLKPQSLYPDNPSNEPTLKWGIITNRYGTFGYLKLESFVPVNGVDFVVDEIIRIIQEEFHSTRGLIFDVRNNGGGYINLADILSQLFMSNNANVIKARLLNTDLNRYIFNNSLFGPFSKPEWTEVINAAEGTGKIYTDVAPFTYESEANGIGQVYFKPVAVLTNARSYSATDIFSCAMQDNKAALIYGEDPRTGAGGANVITHSLFKLLVNDPFETLPLDHEMRVSWRQSIRFGKNEGRLIEDYGCRADVNVSLRLGDILCGEKEQINTITRSLFVRSHYYRSYAQTDLDISGSFILRDELKASVYTANTDYIDMYINDEYYSSIPVYAGNFEKKIDIAFPQNLPSGEVINVTFLGMYDHHFYKKTLWNLKRKIIILDNKVKIGNEGFTIDFSMVDEIEPLTVINNKTEASKGWNLEKPYLQIGYNPVYGDNVNSDAVLFMDLTASTSAHLSFDMEYNTELDFDFIQVFATCGKDKTILLRGSGEQPLQTFDFDMSSFAGKDNVLLHFLFTSDGNTTAPGVRLANIRIE